jgi:nucleoside-diphosphate-sugar epimerase
VVTRRRERSILVTGGGGFIGCHLIRRLSRRYQVYAMARRPLSVEPSQAVVADVRHFRWNGSPLPSSIDIVVHAAALTSHARCRAAPGEAFDANLRGTMNVLQNSIGRVRRFIFLSTGDVYPYREDPIDEEVQPEPSDVYGRSKLEAEVAIEPHRREISLLIVRPFHVFGTGMPSERMLPRFVRMISHGESAHCRPDGGPFLTLTHVDDFIRCIEVLIDSDFEGTLNVAGSDRLSVREIFETLSNRMRSDVRCEVRPSSREGNMIADRRRLIAVTGIDPPERFRTSCEELIEHERIR